MQTLDAQGNYSESFAYGNPYAQVVPPLPSQFDYEGAVLTNAGLLTCLPGGFTLQYGREPAINPDAGLPYGGSPDSNPNYLLFPTLSWSGVAGLFLHVSCTDVAALTFDRAWSGYVGDTFSVVVDGVEVQTLTGSAGYPWVRSSILLSPGDHDLTFVLRCAPYSSGTIRQGVAQDTAVVDLFRFLRLTNLALTNVAALPQADNQKLAMIAESSWTQTNPSLKVTSGTLGLTAESQLIWPVKLSGPLFLQPTTSMSTGAGSFVGKYGQLPLVAESALAVTAAVENTVSPDPGGFGLGSTAALLTESTLTPDVASYARPLMYSHVAMTRPVFVAGRPVSPLALSETEVEYSVEAVVLDKINPISPANVLPLVPTARWLSLGAHHDPVTGQLVTWYDTTGDGSTWTPGAPGVYAPTVGNYAIVDRTTGVQGVNYPAVHFDANHGDHLLASLPAATDGATWMVVGTFARYRGALGDSCPIVDYASPTDVDYSAQRPIQRGVFPWAQPGPSSYLGLVPTNKQEPTVSALAYAAGSGYLSTKSVVVNDNTPMVLIFSSSAAGSFVMATPLLSGQSAAAARMFAELPGALPTAGQTGFALGKARGVPPQNGSFATGTMTLLEVSYFDYAVNPFEATQLSDFLVGLYAPIDAASGPSTAYLGSGNLDSEQCLVYASAPEQPIALISGSKTTVTDWYLSDPATTPYLAALTAAGVPLVQLSNRDYTAIVTAGENR